MRFALLAALGLCLSGCIAITVPEEGDTPMAEPEATDSRGTSSQPQFPSKAPRPRIPVPSTSSSTLSSPAETSNRSFLPHAVVATFDTGVNPFHPAWRTDQDVARGLQDMPEVLSIQLALGQDFSADVAASSGQLMLLKGTEALVSFPGTRIIGARAGATDPHPLFDPTGEANEHGAKASSQIAADGFAVGNHSLVVVFDHFGVPGDSYETYITRQMAWVIEQPWIDIVHVNLAFPAPYPVVNEMMETFVAATAAGKLVVLPAGNGVGNTGLTPPYPQELQHTSGAPGTLVAGANDQCSAGAFWSDLDPHVVMDGVATVAAAPAGYGEDSFAGTSSASPRIAGYVAELLYQARSEVGYTGGTKDGAMIVLDDPSQWPKVGPLSDGRLTPAELHEVVRKTAVPNEASDLDGNPFLEPCPGTPDLGGLSYVKNGYGEVGRNTLPAALAVLLGEAPMPERPVEDTFYALSEAYREAHHDLLT